jgi:replication factor A2
LKQLASSRGVDEIFRVDDVELHTVKLIGKIFEIHDESTAFTFKLNDGTGEMDCKKWKETDMVTQMSFQGGETVRVVGTIREFSGRLHLLVYNVSLVQDWNEVTHHILDVIFTHLQNTKGRVPVNDSFAHAAPSGMQNFGTPARGQGPSLNNAIKKEDKLDEDVFNAYRAGASRQEGLHYGEVQQVLRSNGINISQDQLVRVVVKLCNNGRLYTTIDEEHYRPTVEDF